MKESKKVWIQHPKTKTLINVTLTDEKEYSKIHPKTKNKVIVRKRLYIWDDPKFLGKSGIDTYFIETAECQIPEGCKIDSFDAIHCVQSYVDVV